MNKHKDISLEDTIRPVYACFAWSSYPITYIITDSSTQYPVPEKFGMKSEKALAPVMEVVCLIPSAQPVARKNWRNKLVRTSEYISRFLDQISTDK